jgi:Fe2+ transport system protein FeoA
VHNVLSDFNKVDQPAPHCECTLDCLANGTKGEVCSVTGPNRCRLAELGFSRGCEVEVARKSAFGGPIEVRLRSYRVSLRVEEASGITVRAVED